jgi:hypothetical protein
MTEEDHPLPQTYPVVLVAEVTSTESLSITPVIPVEPPGAMPVMPLDPVMPSSNNDWNAELDMLPDSAKGKKSRTDPDGKATSPLSPRRTGSRHGSWSSRGEAAKKLLVNATKSGSNGFGITTHDQNYVDELLPEDVGISFCIRAAAEFDDMPGYKDPDKKHLHGLQSFFPVPQEGKDQETSGVQQGIRRAVSGVVDRGKGRGSMRFSAISPCAVWVKSALSASAVLSCLFVFASLSVEPACDQQVAKWIIYGHLVNSVLYGMVAIPSRGFFHPSGLALGRRGELVS